MQPSAASFLNHLTYPGAVEKGRAGGHPVMGRVKEYYRSLVGVSLGKIMERWQGAVLASQTPCPSPGFFFPHVCLKLA